MGNKSRNRKPETGNRQPPSFSVLSVTVHPGAGRGKIGPYQGGRLRISVSAPPEKGKANKEAMTLVARWLGLPGRNLAILRGERSRRKEFRIEGIATPALLDRLNEWTPRKNGN